MIRIRVFDTETTGLSPRDLVVECGYHDLINDGEGWQIDRIDSAVFNTHAEGRRCHAEAYRVHKIGPEEIEAGWPYDKLHKFLHFEGKASPCAPDIYAAHNFSFDAKFFTFHKPVICTLKCAKRLWPHAPSHKNGELAIWKGLSLDADLHRVIPDTEATSGLLKLMLEEGHSPEKLVQITGITRQGTANPGNLSNSGEKPMVLHFGPHRGKTLDKVPTHDLQWIAYNSNCRDDLKQAAVRELETR